MTGPKGTCVLGRADWWGERIGGASAERDRPKRHLYARTSRLVGRVDRSPGPVSTTPRVDRSPGPASTTPRVDCSPGPVSTTPRVDCSPGPAGWSPVKSRRIWAILQVRALVGIALSFSILRPRNPLFFPKHALQSREAFAASGCGGRLRRGLFIFLAKNARFRNAFFSEK